MRFPMSACKHWHENETRVYGCLLGEYPFDEEIVLYKNKNNKNNKNKPMRACVISYKPRVSFVQSEQRGDDQFFEVNLSSVLIPKYGT